MTIYANKVRTSTTANDTAQTHHRKATLFHFQDKRPEIVTQGKYQTVADNSTQIKHAMQLQTMANHHTTQQHQNMPIQKKENRTGLPDQLKSGIESLSGYSMDDVKVHYNSSKPSRLKAHAYAQGTDIHLAPRQEKHLPHEAWHVVQQKQGRVDTIMQMGGININDDKDLEKEADTMGTKAITSIVQAQKKS